MGSGDRLTLHRAGCFGLGFSVARFPFSLTLNFQVLLWCLSVGFGKGYDQ